MSNLGLYGYPSGLDARLDTYESVQLGPRWRDPTTRVNWPSAPGALAVAGAEAEVYDLSPSGSLTPCYLEWTLFLRAGVWALTVAYLQSTLYGISQVWIDGTSLGTFDAYTAGANNMGLFYAAPPGVVLGEGTHTVRLGKTGTKNASSTDYYSGPVNITLRRTAVP